MQTLQTPRTIADLKFDWEITRESHDDANLAREKIMIKNPNLIGLKIIPDAYKFLIYDDVIYQTVTDTDSPLHEVLCFFEHLCWKLSIFGHFSHFERINDQTYRIHMKK